MRKNKNIWREKKLISFFDSYDDTLEFKYLFSPLIETLKRKNVGKILDYGCGTGRLTRMLSNLNSMEVYGIDISEEALLVASSRDKKTNYILSPDQKYLLDEKKIDVIVCSFLFVTIKDYKNIVSLINEMYRFLALNGKLYIFEFNLEALGIDFYYFKTSKEKKISTGDTFNVSMRTYQNTFFEFQDFFWDRQVILDCLRNNNFRIDLIDDVKVDYSQDNVEIKGTPFYIIEASKTL